MCPWGVCLFGMWPSVTCVTLIGWDSEMNKCPWSPAIGQHSPVFINSCPWWKKNPYFSLKCSNFNCFIVHITSENGTIPPSWRCDTYLDDCPLFFLAVPPVGQFVPDVRALVSGPVCFRGQVWEYSGTLTNIKWEKLEVKFPNFPMKCKQSELSVHSYTRHQLLSCKNYKLKHNLSIFGSKTSQCAF